MVTLLLEKSTSWLYFSVYIFAGVSHILHLNLFWLDTNRLAQITHTKQSSLKHVIIIISFSSLGLAKSCVSNHLCFRWFYDLFSLYFLFPFLHNLSFTHHPFPRSHSLLSSCLFLYLSLTTCLFFPFTSYLCPYISSLILFLSTLYSSCTRACGHRIFGSWRTCW